MDREPRKIFSRNLEPVTACREGFEVCAENGAHAQGGKNPTENRRPFFLFFYTRTVGEL